MTCAYPDGCDAPAGDADRPEFCALHALTYDDGRGRCKFRGCRNVRTEPLADGLCRIHTRQGHPEPLQSDKRVMARVAEGMDLVGAVAMEKGLDDRGKASRAVDRMMRRPEFRDGVESILKARGIDPNEGVVDMWESMVQGVKTANKTTVSDGEVVDMGPDWQARVACATILAKVGPGFATQKQEVRSDSTNVTITVPQRQPIPDDAIVVDALTEDDD